MKQPVAGWLVFGLRQTALENPQAMREFVAGLWRGNVL